MAVVLGYDITTRVARAIYPSSFERGFHPMTVAGALGAATAAGKLLGLGSDGLSHAISIASTFSCGITEAYGSMPSVLGQIGRASESGVLAALLAQGGLKGSPTALEGGFLSRGGFLGAYSDAPDPKKVTEGLGEDYLILRNTIKMYGGCRHNHASIDAVMEIIEKQGIGAEQIDEVRVRTYKLATEFQVQEPQNDTGLKFCLPFALCLGILEARAIMPDKFKMEKFQSGPFQDLMRKIKIEHDPQMDADFPKRWPAAATVRTKNGESFSHAVELPKGEPEWPFSQSEIDFKFRYLAGKSLEKDRLDKIISIINDLQRLKDFSQLISLLKIV
jgi:2-methylcitrate dehydratase PrpD